jgi:hypothetical protein
VASHATRRARRTSRSWRGCDGYARGRAQRAVEGGNELSKGAVGDCSTGLERRPQFRPAGGAAPAATSVSKMKVEQSTEASDQEQRPAWQSVGRSIKRKGIVLIGAQHRPSPASSERFARRSVGHWTPPVSPHSRLLWSCVFPSVPLHAAGPPSSGEPEDGQGVRLPSFGFARGCGGPHGESWSGCVVLQEKQEKGHRRWTYFV